MSDSKRVVAAVLAYELTLAEEPMPPRMRTIHTRAIQAALREYDAVGEDESASIEDELATIQERLAHLESRGRNAR